MQCKSKNRNGGRCRARALTGKEYCALHAEPGRAAAVVLAAEQGFLSLDDDVRKYVPELPDYGHVITLRQMIH
jgi:Beta-lactamase